MAEFKLTQKAVEDLSKIWDYTLEIWSEGQADTYYNMSFLACQKIADSPNLGKEYDGVAQHLLGMKANRHIIFYRIMN